jgi:hypothetical protein
MNVPRYELRERIHHGDDGLAEVAVFHTGGTPQAPGAGHVAPMGRGARTQWNHSIILI